MDQTLGDQVSALVRLVASRCSSNRTRGSFSPSVYDTAWLAMIQKPAYSGVWLFPECFDYVLEQQLPCGAWDSYATPTDGILNTAASLLALKKHLHITPGGIPKSYHKLIPSD